MKSHRLRIIKATIIFSTAVILIIAGCVSNTLLLETRVNDPIMMNLLDNDLDIAQIEDGTGFVGEASSCPT